MSDATVRPDLVVADRWQPVKFEACPAGRRTIDVNHGRSEVRWFCEKCRRAHTLRVGAVS